MILIEDSRRNLHHAHHVEAAFRVVLFIAGQIVLEDYDGRVGAISTRLGTKGIVKLRAIFSKDESLNFFIAFPISSWVLPLHSRIRVTSKQAVLGAPFQPVFVGKIRAKWILVEKDKRKYKYMLNSRKEIRVRRGARGKNNY